MISRDLSVDFMDANAFKTVKVLHYIKIEFCKLKLKLEDVMKEYLKEATRKYGLEEPLSTTTLLDLLYVIHNVTFTIIHSSQRKAARARW